jgi:hypothetical protein
MGKRNRSGLPQAACRLLANRFRLARAESALSRFTHGRVRVSDLALHQIPFARELTAIAHEVVPQ